MSNQILVLKYRNVPLSFGRRGGTLGRKRSNAFTLIELVVSLGIIMILIGLLMPSLGRSFKEARRLSRVSLLRQHTASVFAYARDFRDCFSWYADHPYRVARFWYSPMISRGYLPTRLQDVDPQGYRDDGQVGLAMSVAMAYDADRMIPGKTFPIESMVSVPQRVASVSFPSDKAALFRYWVRDDGGKMNWWCCGPPPHAEAEVSMMDGSADIGEWPEYFPTDVPLVVENGIGQPVVTTWFGVHGRDRR